MRELAENIVDALLEGRVTDWLKDRWGDVKYFTGIGYDEYGMGKPEKGFKPKFRSQVGSHMPDLRRPTRYTSPKSSGEKTWKVG